MMSKKVSQKRDAAPLDIAEDSNSTTLVCQATSQPDLEVARLRQAEEGHASLMAGRRTSESSPTASCYFLHSGPDLPMRWTGRAWCEASHLTHEGNGYKNRI